MLDRGRHRQFSFGHDWQLHLALAGVLVNRLGNDVADRPTGRSGHKITCTGSDPRRADQVINAPSAPNSAAHPKMRVVSGPNEVFDLTECKFAAPDCASTAPIMPSWVAATVKAAVPTAATMVDLLGRLDLIHDKSPNSILGRSVLPWAGSYTVSPTKVRDQTS